jgi:hypothetical protein
MTMTIEEMFANKDAETEEVEAEETEIEEELPETDPEADALVEVSVRGRKIQVSPEDAAAIREFQKEVRDRDGARGGELAQLREQLARLEGQMSAVGRSTEPEIRPPDPKLALSDFAAWQTQQIAYTESLVAKKEAELLARYESDMQERTARERSAASNQAWADAFYAEHDEFDKPTTRKLVSVVYQEHERDILSLTDPREQRERLAELAGVALEDIVSTGASRNTGARPPKVAGARRSAKAVETETEEKPISLAARAKQLRQKLRDGRAA